MSSRKSKDVVNQPLGEDTTVIASREVGVASENVFMPLIDRLIDVRDDHIQRDVVITELKVLRGR